MKFEGLLAKLIEHIRDNPNKVEVIHKEFWTKDIATHSPDMVNLFRHQWLRIFVCDEMMKAHAEHHLLGEKHRLSWKAITHSKFTVVKFNGSHGEMVVPLKFRLADAPWCPIRGELYSITPHQLIELDKYKENGVCFQRFRINLRIPLRRLASEYWAKDRDTFLRVLEQSPYEEHNVHAWMYVGVPHFWNDIITCACDEGEDLRYIKQTFRWKEGQLMPVIKNKLFKPLNSFIPKNKLLEEYYYNARSTAVSKRRDRRELPVYPYELDSEFAAISIDGDDDSQQAA